jgi:hypothetical protein
MNIKTIFKRLLADLSNKTGVFIDSPDDLDSQWLLIEAPALNKEMLSCLENHHGSFPATDSDIILVDHPGLKPLSENVSMNSPKLERASGVFWIQSRCRTYYFSTPRFPDWLMPLWLRFVFSNEVKYLRAMIQILVFCYKIEQIPTNEQIEVARKSYRQNEVELATWREGFKPSAGHLFRLARNTISSIIYRANWQEIVPSHGPGAVYPPAKPKDRTFFTTDYDAITSVYPIDKYFALLPDYWDETIVRQSKYMDIKSDRILSNLVLVPKDTRGPRTICVHPAEAIWIQQGLRKELERCVKRSKFSKYINFEDQTVNQRLAR